MKTVTPVRPFRTHLLVAAALASLACTASAVDTLFNIDFNAPGAPAGTYAGSAPAGGGVWNGLSFAANTLGTTNSGAIISSTGGASALTISISNFNVYSAGERPAALAPALMTDFFYQRQIGPTGPDSSFAIRNLDLTATYDIYLYAQNGGYAGTATIFNIGGVPKTATNTGVNVTSFTENQNYVLYTGLTADALGVISGTFNSAKVADNAAFNGLQIVQHGGTPPPVPVNAARTIGVDFNRTGGTNGTYVGNAAAPNAGTLWNGLALGTGALVPNYASPVLNASDGSATAVTFTLGNYVPFDSGTQPLAGGGLFGDFVYQSAGGSTTGPDGTFGLQNLDPLSTYDLYLYAQNGTVGSASTKFTFNGITKIATGAGNSATLVEDRNYVLYRGLTPDALGSISGTFNNNKPADNASFNGFQLVQVPEPATMSFLAAGGVFALMRRRRQS